MKIKLKKKKSVALPFSNIRRMCRIMFLFRYDLEYSRLLDCFLLFIIPWFPRCNRSGREQGGGEAHKWTNISASPPLPPSPFFCPFTSFATGSLKMTFGQKCCEFLVSGGEVEKKPRLWTPPSASSFLRSAGDGTGSAAVSTPPSASLPRWLEAAYLRS